MLASNEYGFEFVNARVSVDVVPKFYLQTLMHVVIGMDAA